jgi:hypothetical protein
VGTDSKIPDSADIPEPPTGSVDCQYRITDRGEVTDFAEWAEAVAAYAALRHAGRTPRVWHRHRTEPWTSVTDRAEDATTEVATPLPAVYVIEQRINLAAGGHAFMLLPAGFAYPSIVNAQAAVEHMDGGTLRWNERLEASLPGDRLPLYRIVEVPLAATRGGAR